MVFVWVYRKYQKYTKYTKVSQISQNYGILSYTSGFTYVLRKLGRTFRYLCDPLISPSNPDISEIMKPELMHRITKTISRPGRCKSDKCVKVYIDLEWRVTEEN
jgi:hypothetical protein